MKLKIITGIVLALFLIGILTLAFNIQPVKASGTIYIRADGSVDPPTANITSVDNVTYTFTGNINDSIFVERNNIVVDGAGYTLQGTGSGWGINITMRSNVTIKNIEIKTFWCGITLGYSSNNIFSGNNITNNHYHGIGLIASSNNTISRNNIEANNGCGIELIHCSNNSIFGNNITNNHEGIVLYRSSNNILRGNSMANSTYNFGVNVITFPDSVNDVDVSNTVDGKPIYYWINERDMAVPLDTGYVALVNCTRIILQNLSLTNNRQGMLLASTTNSTITKNKITNNHDEGIHFYNSSKNTIYENNITNNFEGIRLRKSSNNTISGHNITNNYYGVCLQDSSNNAIYHNNFVDNKRQVYISYSTNVWDAGYPSGGNYWSDYKGIDLYSGPYQNETGSDGIGDTSYIIYTFGEERGRDRYPLMYPLGLPIAPRAIFSCSSSTLTPNETVTFNASASVPGWNSTHKVPIANYTWDFGDGTSPVTETDPITTHNYTAVGTYTVNLTVMCQDDPVLIAQGLTLSPITVEEIQVIPEFPTWTSILLLLTVLSVVIAIYKRRLLKTLIH